MSKLTFLTGGARSGKSSFALELAKKSGKRIVFVATCVPQDDEMLHRVKLHKASRPKTWKTVEEPYNIVNTIEKNKPQNSVFIIDCLTLWLSNMILIETKEKDIINQIKKLIDLKNNYNSSIIVISNEVGSGIVPENKLARDFRDLAGKINQLLAKSSDEAYLLVSGIPLRLR